MRAVIAWLITIAAGKKLDQESIQAREACLPGARLIGSFQ
jgi:hypothetical protein